MMNVADYKGVWVFAEQRDGSLQKVSLELLGKGREIAEKIGVKLTAVLLGEKVSGLTDTLIEHGADEVILAEHPLLAHYTTDAYTKVMCDLVHEYKPEVLFIGASFIGRDLGPRVAARLGTGLTADCTGLDVDSETKFLMATRPAFGGNIMATIECQNHRPQMATVRPGVFEKAKLDGHNGTVKKTEVELKKEDIRTEVVEVHKEHKEVADIQAANFIISGGRGVGCQENFCELQELADTLGGVVGASRAAVDSGWREKDYQVGQTGKTVRPNVYIACGISGAIQHLAGMQDSDYIIAINKDENAPIMKVADVGIVGDLHKILPEVVKQLKAMKENQ